MEVGMTGFEPATSCPPDKHSKTKLSYIPQKSAAKIHYIFIINGFFHRYYPKKICKINCIYKL